MSEWDSQTFGFTIEAGTTDPTTTNSWASSDMAVVCFLDASYSRTSDNQIVLDIHDHSENELNVGSNEAVWSPITSTVCTVIEAI